MGTHTLKTAFKLDGALYYQKEKLSIITVKEEEKKKISLPFATNINTFCQFSSLLSNLVLSPHVPFLSLFFFMVFLVFSCAQQCISLKLLIK